MIVVLSDIEVKVIKRALHRLKKQELRAIERRPNQFQPRPGEVDICKETISVVDSLYTKLPKGIVPVGEATVVRKRQEYR
jgi:hypothetical protein